MAERAGEPAPPDAGTQRGFRRAEAYVTGRIGEFVVDPFLLCVRDGDVIACLLPLAFSPGLFQVLTAARTGAAVLLETSFAYPRDVLERMSRHAVTEFPSVTVFPDVTVFPGVPTIWGTPLPMAPFDGVALGPPQTATSSTP
jgi:acyl-CoA synthetase (AMP-forming)/AMP-acid ligase II